MNQLVKKANLKPFYLFPTIESPLIALNNQVVTMFDLTVKEFTIWIFSSVVDSNTQLLHHVDKHNNLSGAVNASSFSSK